MCASELICVTVLCLIVVASRELCPELCDGPHYRRLALTWRIGELVVDGLDSATITCITDDEASVM